MRRFTAERYFYCSCRRVAPEDKINFYDNIANEEEACDIFPAIIVLSQAISAVIVSICAQLCWKCHFNGPSRLFGCFE